MSELATLPHGFSERAILGLLSAVQFVNIVDFMMVMPLVTVLAILAGLTLPPLVRLVETRVAARESADAAEEQSLALAG